MAAHPENYWKSEMNVFDFVVVLLCVISIPVYWFVPDSDIILAIILLLRFAAQLLRIVMIYKHHENRNAFLETTRDDVVDFTGLENPSNSEPSVLSVGQLNNHTLSHNGLFKSSQSSASLYAAQSPSYQNGSNFAVSRQDSGRSSRYNAQWE